LTRNRIAHAAIWSVLVSVGSAAQETPPLPEGNAYVRGVLSSARPQDAAINDYSYDLEEIRENLDKNGIATSRETRRLEVFFVKTRPVRRLVAKNGVPLGKKEQAEVDKKAEAQAQAIASGQTVSEQAGIRLSLLLDSFDFKTLAREEREGRQTLVFAFEPRKGASKASSGRTEAVTRILHGTLRVDEADRRVARLDARTAEGEKAGVATGVKLSAFELQMEFKSVEDGVWLPARVVTVASGRAFLFKTFRVRQTTLYSNYRKFRVDTEERPLK
jgi:hypothetical protein